MQLALVAGLVVGTTAPLIGTFLVQRRLSLMGDGVGHVAFAGVAAGLVAG
ncbi:MAG: metal ABC transporter permease, partial [Actinomycetota bacterium]|nr:metal ABC transporter permease [Actinomycetota bacterium]